MIIGVPKEIKDLETRVGLTPRYVKLLTEQGHKVLIQKGLAAAADVADEEYIKAGKGKIEKTKYAHNTWNDETHTGTSVIKDEVLVLEI